MVLTWRVETDILSNWCCLTSKRSLPSKCTALLIVLLILMRSTLPMRPCEFCSAQPWFSLNQVLVLGGLRIPETATSSSAKIHGSSQQANLDGRVPDLRFLTTRGNDAIAQLNRANTPNYLNNPRPYHGSFSFRFDYPPEDIDWKFSANA